jgi:hypothetical protein
MAEVWESRLLFAKSVESGLDFCSSTPPMYCRVLLMKPSAPFQPRDDGPLRPVSLTQNMRFFPHAYSCFEETVSAQRVTAYAQATAARRTKECCANRAVILNEMCGVWLRQSQLSITGPSRTEAGLVKPFAW